MRVLKEVFTGGNVQAVFWALLIGWLIQKSFEYPHLITTVVLFCYLAVRGIVLAEMEKIDVEIRSRE